MSDIFCSGRSTECGCPPHLCAAAPVEELTYRPTIWDILKVSLFITVAAGFITFAVAARLEQTLKTQDQIAQENVNVTSR